jgi:hypothetical protein
MPDIPGRLVQEVAHQRYLREVCVFECADGRHIVAEDLRTGTSEENRRMRRDDELRAALGGVVHEMHELKLSLGRERRFRLVEIVDLPDPLSPAKSVTGQENASGGSVLIAGTQNGNSSGNAPSLNLLRSS